MNVRSCQQGDYFGSCVWLSLAVQRFVFVAAAAVRVSRCVTEFRRNVEMCDNTRNLFSSPVMAGRHKKWAITITLPRKPPCVLSKLRDLVARQVSVDKQQSALRRFLGVVATSGGRYEFSRVRVVARQRQAGTESPGPLNVSLPNLFQRLTV